MVPDLFCWKILRWHMLCLLKLLLLLLPGIHCVVIFEWGLTLRCVLIQKWWIFNKRYSEFVFKILKRCFCIDFLYSLYKGFTFNRYHYNLLFVKIQRSQLFCHHKIEMALAEIIRWTLKSQVVAPVLMVSLRFKEQRVLIYWIRWFTNFLSDHIAIIIIYTLLVKFKSFKIEQSD